ncbi:hypothetical protein GOP47_0024187 [Adiantum capillus-veneris]|uniref:Uncharacterized protein n=1 Tax=Adiantum capillus-veneris TaxID=13818 RepID=A0A9D4U5D0_ADICA|nr:hypothetical protein GOP47_0024187 [Adiantum capillus-veneris]
MADKDLHSESDMGCMSFEGPTAKGMLEEQVGLVLQEELPLEDRLPKVGAMLLMDVLLKVVLQVPLCRLPQVILFEDSHDMANSLAIEGETCDAKAFQDV